MHAHTDARRTRVKACIYVEMERKYFRLYSSDFMAENGVSQVKQIAPVLVRKFIRS